MGEKLSTSARHRKYTQLGFRIIGDFGATIAIPVVLFVIIGQKVDSYYGWAYRATFIAFVLAALLTGRFIWTKAKAYGREYHDLNT